MYRNTEVRRTGLTLLEVLLVIFVVLKLCGLIDWPWLVVLWPLWIQLGLIAIILIVFVIIAIANKIKNG